MITVSIIGFGNVAQHLAAAFYECPEISLLQLFSRKIKPNSILPFEVEMIHRLEELKEADLYIIATFDGAIAEISKKLPFENRLLAHTSGSVSMTDMDDKNRRAVFYPLQTFSKNKQLDFKNIPICLESESDHDYQMLEKVAKLISLKVVPINSEQRKSLHVSAVFINNFTNHLYHIADEICSEQNVSFEILKPLILETADKIMTLSPKDAQTGPAKRNDLETIHSHLKFLGKGNRKNIYQLLTQSIIEDGKKL